MQTFTQTQTQNAVNLQQMLTIYDKRDKYMCEMDFHIYTHIYDLSLNTHYMQRYILGPWGI